MTKLKFAKSVLNLSFIRYNRNFDVFNNRTNFINLKPIRNLCIATNSTQNLNKIVFQFSNGFFKFKVNENNFIMSFWTPLKSLIQEIDTNQTSITSPSQLIDEQNKVSYSSTTPIGFVFSNLQSLSFKHPSLGLCQIEFNGNNTDLIKWKEKFESEQHYGIEKFDKKEIDPEEPEILFLEHEKDALNTVFRPLLKEYQKIVSLARIDANRKFKWGGLFLLSAQLGFVARLTWFEYSWDIMEPITWMLTYAMMVGTFAYYIVTSQEYLVPSVERRLTISKFWKLAQKHNFDVTNFRKIREQLKVLNERIIRLKAIN